MNKTALALSGEYQYLKSCDGLGLLLLPVLLLVKIADDIPCGGGAVCRRRGCAWAKVLGRDSGGLA